MDISGGGGTTLFTPGEIKAEVPMPRWKGLYTVLEKPRETQMGTHRFSAHRFPMLLAAPKRKTKVLLVACDTLSDTPLTSSLPTSLLSCLSSLRQPPCGSPYTFQPLPASELALPCWAHLSLVSPQISAQMSSSQRGPPLHFNQNIRSPHPHRAAGHSPAIVLSSLHLVSEMIRFIYSFLACLPR